MLDKCLYVLNMLSPVNKDAIIIIIIICAWQEKCASETKSI